ncbi:barstar family protein [Cytobacillus sp. IB215665]|nr:barstar family protein [Cytobacillus sp. IB215665]
MELWKQLMQNGSVKLFWRNEILDKYISAISREGFEVYTFDCSNWDSNNYHIELAYTLDFPDYYGENIDALNDCLSEMLPEDNGIVLVFKNYDVFFNKEPKDAREILDLVQSNSWQFLLENIKLLAFVQSNDATIHFSGLGGMPAEWNDEEWSNKNRGL